MSVVETVKNKALASAAAYMAAVAERERRYRLERMCDIVQALDDRFDEEAGAFLAALGVTKQMRGVRLVLLKDGWAFAIVPNDDMTVSANGTTLRPDPRFPLLTGALYGEIAGRIVRWAAAIDDGTAREV